MHAIGLQYVDAFRWPKSSGKRFAEVLSTDSGFIPKTTFDRPSYWHVYQGWFSKSISGGRVLNVVHVDFVDDADDYVLRITGQHRLQALSFDDSAQPRPLSVDAISVSLDELHALNKRALLSVLTPEMVSAIGMKPSVEDPK